MSTGAMRQTALRAGGACVRCRKGKTKCVYENGRAPCRNCVKGMHDCYLPSESNAHIHGQTPTRQAPSSHRPARESLPGSATAVDPRAILPSNAPSRGGSSNPEKITPELMHECERIISKSFPACVAFHKPSFITQLKNGTLDLSVLYALLSYAARSSTTLIRRYQGATPAAEHFAAKAMARITDSMDHPSLSDIQALCLIIIHEWGSKNAVRAYAYLGLAVRLMQMHRILNNTQYAQPDENRFLKEESLRRTLWLLHILDCFLTSTPGRYPALSTHDYSGVSLPCSDMNFAFGNAVFVKTLHLHDPVGIPPGTHAAEVGEYGHIVLATTMWREVVQMLTTSSTGDVNEETCATLMGKIDHLRESLPMQFIDKPGQVGLHITMGSGHTYVMLHCILHCATIFVYRRRLLQSVASPDFSVETWRNTPQCHEIVDRIMASCHTTTSLIKALQAEREKDYIIVFPIFTVFAAFTASATVAYLSMKRLIPPNYAEMAELVVHDGLGIMEYNVNTWPLIQTWLRHLTVMQRVLVVEAQPPAAAPTSVAPGQGASPSVKDDVGSNRDASEAQDGDTSLANHNDSVSGSVRDESEPPVPMRKSGFTTINGGGSAGVSTPATGSPPPNNADTMGSASAKGEGQSAQPAPADMTAVELCAAYERQLFELDDLAAFMGGGV